MKKVALGFFISATAISAHAQPNFSGDLLIGLADQDTDFEEYGSTSGDDVSFGIRGAYNFNENFAIELAYQNYGETDDSYVDGFGDSINDQVSATAITAGVKGSIPLQNGFSLSARAGASQWDADIRSTDSAFPGQVFTAGDDGVDLYYGIGAQFEMSEAFSVGAEYTITDMGVSFKNADIEGSLDGDHEIKNLAIFISYSFQ